MSARSRSAEDDASYKGMGAAITMLRERAGMSCAELAGGIEVGQVELEKIERGQQVADWGTLRDLARKLGVPLHTLMELAEELAPGEGGEEWRRWSRDADRRRAID